MKITALSLALAFCLGAPLPAFAAHDSMPGMDMSAPAKAEQAQGVGVVDQIDAAKGIVTISHEPIKSLDWPAMTMDFVVKDKKLIGKLTKGKKVRFTFIQQHGDYVIIKVE